MSEPEIAVVMDIATALVVGLIFGFGIGLFVAEIYYKRLRSEPARKETK